MGDVGIALLALWLTAQINPGIPLFAVNFEPGLPQAAVAVAATTDIAATMLEAVQSAFQLVGVGLFLALLLRDRRNVGSAVLLLIGLSFVLKGAAAWLVLKPAAWEAWLKPGVAIGIAAGSLGLLLAAFLPRPAQIAACAIALLSSLLLPLAGSDASAMPAPLTLFNWRYGHLLNFNGLTHTVLLVWPIAEHQGEKQPDARKLECGLRRFDHRRGEVRRRGNGDRGRRQPRFEIDGEERDARIDLRRQPQGEQRDAYVAKATFDERLLPRRGQRPAHALRAHEGAPEHPAHERATGICE